MALWVDDFPQGNLTLARTIESRYDCLEILRVTSTRIAETWMKDYSWVFARTNLQIKILSDMHREEEGGADATAGITLMRALRKHGFSTKVLIFTGNVDAARERALEVNASPQELEMITNSSQAILDFFAAWIRI